MPILPMPLASAGEAATIWLFGGNILAPRAPMTGPGSYAEAVEALGVTGVRYPGGSLTESYFDLSNPDATTVVHNETGEEQDFMPLSDVMAYAEETGRAVTIVLPTREQVSTRRNCAVSCATSSPGNTAMRRWQAWRSAMNTGARAG